MTTGEPVTGRIEQYESPQGIRLTVTDKIPYRDPEGNLLGLIGFAIDITDLRYTAGALFQSEGKLRAQYTSIPIPTYTWQRVEDDFVLVDCNEAATRFTQGKISRLLQRRASEIYGHRPDIVEDLSRCYAERTTVEREMSYQLISTGEEKHLSVKYAYVPRDQVLVHTEDITEHRRAEEALRDSEERNRFFFENAAIGTGIADLEGYIHAANRATCALFGYTMEELLARNVRDLYFNPDDRLETVRHIQARGRLTDFEVSLKRKDGTPFDGLLSAELIQFAIRHGLVSA